MTLRRSSGFATLALALLFACVLPVCAQDNWQQGRQAFEGADYASALTYFEAARDAGQSGPAVHYNIGVCQYKLERYIDAEATFTLIARQFPQMRKLAEYNLGLVAVKRRSPDAARAHFLTAYELSADDEKLRILSSNMLQRTASSAEVPTYWLGSFGFRAGFDDNVALRDELGLPAGTTTDSPMVDAFVSVQGPYRENSRLRLDAAAYAITYLDIHDFDQNVLRLGAVYDWYQGDWHTEIGLHAGYGTLGGDGFDQSANANVRVNRRLSAESQVSAQYRYDDVSAATSVFAGIDGSRQRVDLRYRWAQRSRSLILRLVYETNDRIDPGVSPDRSDFRIDYRYEPETGFGFEAGAQYRSSEYKSLVPVRSEDLTMIRIGISKSLRSNWQLLGQIQHSDNNSSDSQFSYQRNVITIGALKIF